MFRCERCGRVSKPHDKQHRVVVEERAVTYKDGSSGHEIVRELRVCGECRGQAADKE